MKIENYMMAMQTEHKASESITTTGNAEMWTTSLTQGMEIRQASASNDISELLQDSLEKLRYALVESLLNIFAPNQQNYSSSMSTSNLVTLSKANEMEFQRLGIPFTQVTYTEERKVSEYVNASMQGCVQTSDGREIALDVKLGLSQSFCNKTEITQAVFTDPLVINFDGELPELEETCFAFDIDCDGKNDQISQLSSGSGFLALDKNDNGTVDDGSELFGTESGNGFADLAEYDEDGNDWIDEGDDIFNSLRVWSTDGENSQLVALGESGIGAIYLGSADSDFIYRNGTGESLGALRSTGMFLNEDGSVGNISQVDFAKQSTKEETGGLARALTTLDA